MASNSTTPARLGQPVPRRAVDRPTATGPLAEILLRQRVSAVSDDAGHVLLVRPDSVLVDAPAGKERSRLGRALPKLIPGAKAEFADDDLGIVSLPVPERRATSRAMGGDTGGAEPPPASIIHANEMLDALRSDGFTAEYNHVVIGSQVVSGSPLGVSAHWAGDMAFVGTITDETEDGAPVLLSTAMPAPAPDTLRKALKIPGKKAPRVLILDTGLRTKEVPVKGAGKGTMSLKPEHSELTCCQIHPNWVSDLDPGDVDDEDEENDDHRTILDFEAGHGTFIAGVIRQICPDAVVHSAGVLSSFGDGDVYGVIKTFRRIIHEAGPFDIVVMSFGTNLIGDEPGLFGRELTELLGDAVGVAAAGNQSTCRPYFPAALPNVIGVGGLAADGKAWFTNFGGWVDACAPAIDVVSTFFTKFDEVLHIKADGVVTPTITREYKGWARWSGTSFAAPKVAALIAQELYLNGGTAKDAWKRLTSYEQFRYPDLGIVFNV